MAVRPRRGVRPGHCGRRAASYASPESAPGLYLGSAYATVNSGGWKLNELRYEAYGETRYANGSLPTARRYTGQSSFETTTGLYFYNSRWYDDPSVGGWTQPDSITPDQYNVLAWS